MWNGDEQVKWAWDNWDLQQQTQALGNQDIAVNRPGDLSMYLGLNQQPAPSPHARRDTVGSPPKYEKVEFVGRGSFGEAWKVKYVNTGREYVLKTLHMRGLTEQDMKRGLNEIKALKKCDHENIVKYFDDLMEDKSIMIIMELCPGGDLSQEIEKQKRYMGLFTQERVFRWCYQLNEGLYYLKTKRIVHRDLKPDNIFLTAESALKIGDFGLARLVNTYLIIPYYTL